MSSRSLLRLTASAASVAAFAGAAGQFASPTAAAAPATPRCATSALVVWLDTAANRAAGSTYYRLEFTNLAGHACTLLGYPGVSGINLAGRRLGNPAARNPAHPARLVTLRSGATGTSVLQITDPHNFPIGACRPQTAAGLRVYPPGQTASRVVPFPFLACSHSGSAYLHVEAVR